MPIRYDSHAGILTTVRLTIHSRNQHLIQSPFPTPYSYVSPKELEVLGGESHFVKMFECMCSHTSARLVSQRLFDAVADTTLTDYSKYLSIHPGMVSGHTSCDIVYNFGIGSPGLPPMAWRRAENQRSLPLPRTFRWQTTLWATRNVTARSDGGIYPQYD